MALETYGTIEHLQQEVPIEPPVPGISMLTSALLQALVVQFGLVYKFYFNSLRGRRVVIENGEDSVESASRTAYVVSFITFAASCCIFMWTTATTLQYINDGTYADKNDRQMIVVVTILTVVQIGYPAVAVFEGMWLCCKPLPPDQYSEELSTIKDVAYAALDVTTKGGGALVAFLIATRT
tara:strand:- start:442 stop:984 length:543 start_codon:yes stop_codon:yes gene_type:complete